MKTRYFKYYFVGGTGFEWYRIKHDGTVERRITMYQGGNFGEWYEVKDGFFSTLIEDKLEEISEEEYFLDSI